MIKSPSLTADAKMLLLKTRDASREAMTHRLTIARMAAGLTKSRLAQECGLTIQSYSNQESGRIGVQPGVMRTLYRGYGIDYTYFYEGEFTHLSADVRARLFQAAYDLANCSNRASGKA